MSRNCYMCLRSLKTCFIFKVSLCNNSAFDYFCFLLYLMYNLFFNFSFQFIHKWAVIKTTQFDSNCSKQFQNLNWIPIQSEWKKNYVLLGLFMFLSIYYGCSLFYPASVCIFVISGNIYLFKYVNPLIALQKGKIVMLFSLHVFFFCILKYFTLTWDLKVF